MASYSKVLITGGSGFLGWNLAKYAADIYDDVSFTYYKHPVTIEGCQGYRLNLQNPQEIGDVVTEVNPEVIIHTAALANADTCETRRSKAHAINVSGTRFIAQCAEDLGARFIYISTDLVFDGQKGHYTENDRPNPVNYYAETKLLAENVVKEILSDYLIVRMALMYGNSGEHNSCFSDWLREGLKQQKSLRLYTDQYRTPLLVMDGIRAIVELLEQSVQNETFHLGGKERLNRYEFGKRFAKLLECSDQYLLPVTMQEVETKAARGGDCSLNSQKIQPLLSFELSDVTSGLREMMQNGQLV
jgi:dTDP-4-dehydrorhamnose reductase